MARFDAVSAQTHPENTPESSRNPRTALRSRPFWAPLRALFPAYFALLSAASPTALSNPASTQKVALPDKSLNPPFPWWLRAQSALRFSESGTCRSAKAPSLHEWFLAGDLHLHRNATVDSPSGARPFGSAALIPYACRRYGRYKRIDVKSDARLAGGRVLAGVGVSSFFQLGDSAPGKS